MKYSIVTVIETQERHEKSPKKRQLLKPDAAPLGDSSYIVSSFPSVKDPIPWRNVNVSYSGPLALPD